MTRPYQFQTNILDKIIQKCEDEKNQDDLEFIEELVGSFQTYANTVLTFEDKIKSYKETHDATEYRSQTMELDRKRTNQHNVAMSSIDILNRLAEQHGLDPFCILPTENGTKDVNRTDLGTEMLNWTNDIFKIVSEEKAKKFGLDSSIRESSYQSEKDISQYSKERTLSKEDQLIQDFNGLAKDNPYPIIKKDDHYDFRHIFTQQVVPIEQAKTKILDIIEHQNLTKEQKEKKTQIVKDATMFVSIHQTGKTQNNTQNTRVNQLER